MSTLQDILSKDDKAWKLFVICWRSWGPSRSFKGEGQARIYVETMTMLNLLKVKDGSSGDVKNIEKIKLSVDQRQNLITAADKLLSQGDADDTHGKNIVFIFVFIYNLQKKCWEYIGITLFVCQYYSQTDELILVKLYTVVAFDVSVSMKEDN